MSFDACAQTFFGIRLGESLEQQFQECQKGDMRWTASEKPCWRRLSQYVRTVAMPRQLQTLSATLEVRSVREDNGRVVEVELEFRPEEGQAIERYLQAKFGKPADVEVYERHSRVRGHSKHRSLSWKAGGMTVIFLELAASDNGSVRAYLDAWAEAEGAREREKQAAEVQALNEKSRKLQALQNSPIAALDRALRNRNSSEVRSFLEPGINLSTAPSDGTTVLHTAAVMWGDVEILKQLVDAGASVNALDDAGRTPLAAALATAHYRTAPDGNAQLIKVFDFFASRKANLQTKDSKGGTLVSVVLDSRDRLPVVEYLLKKNLPLPQDGLIAVLEAGANDDDFRRFPVLVDKVERRHVVARNASGRTALHLAVRSENTIVLAEGLLNFGADIEARTQEGWTAFGEACFYGNSKAMDLLAKRGANLNVKAKDGSTALHIAAPFARLSQIRWLIQHGLDPNVRDAGGQRPLDIVIKSERLFSRGDTEIQEILTLLGGSTRDLPARQR